MVAFPLSPVPSYYASCSFPTRNGIFLAGSSQQPQITLSKAGATAYTVRDYTGMLVSSGAVSGTVVTPTAPEGGWPCGWYRIYFTGASTDALFGASFGATNFVVIPDAAGFPANPAPGTSGSTADSGQDWITKGVLGIGTSRLSINNAAAPTTGNSTLTAAQANAALSSTWWVGNADGKRPRDLWCNFPNQAYDRLTLAGAITGTFLRVYPATGSIDGGTVFIAVSPGTTLGTKIQVYSPDFSTLVETFDNLISDVIAAQAINRSSTRIRVFAGGQTSGAALAATAIGGAYRAGVAQVVAGLYPTVRFFEGPSNEPQMNAETAQQMQVFAGAVHAGNAAAKAIGPCPVTLNDIAGWEAFLAAGGGNWCDEFSAHDYNAANLGNLSLARTKISSWWAVAARYGQGSKPRWQTEAGVAFKSVVGVYHPRRALWKLLHTLIWEQYGVPSERNTTWYDRSMGFWAYPAWLINGDTSLNPDAVMLRTLCEQTQGRPYASALSFGRLGDQIFVGNVYTGDDGSTVVICASSHMPGQQVTLAVTGTDVVTVVDAWGNSASTAISGGRITIATPGQPVYVRLPMGAKVAVHTVADWPAIGVRGQGDNSATRAAASTRAVNDEQWITTYDGTNTGLHVGSTSLPDAVTLAWETPARFDRVLIWNAMSWQNGSSLLDFDIQTSNDAFSWTTRATVTKTATSFQHGTDATNAGCQYETYWDEQWIFDVKLSQPVTAKYLRLLVRATSYGGEPDAQTLSAGGQGGPQRILIQEVAVLCDDNVIPQYVTG